MAKTLAYSGGPYTVNSASKDIIWTIDETNKDFKLKFETSEDYTGIGASNSNYTVGYKDGNDLVLVTNFLIKKNNSVKSVKNTIKNYFTTDGASVVFYNADNSELGALTAADVLNYASGNILSAPDVADFSAAEKKKRFWGSKKADTYNLLDYYIYEDSPRGIVYDEAGNDRYFASSGYYNVFDFKGNDKYTVTGAKLTINDYTGNDKYMMNSTIVDVTDLAGNDNYDLSSVSANSKVVDYKGNDKYALANSTNYQLIYDYTGKDKYELIDAIAYIYEHDGTENPANKSGNDIYNVYGSDFTRIEEKSSYSGNDIYNFTSLKSSYIHDAAGNDKYNFRESEQFTYKDDMGNDKYNVISSWANTAEEFEYGITDGYGNDNYNISNSSFKIVDNYGKDKYAINNDSNDVKIIDKHDNDTYSVLDSRNVIVKDSGQSNDKYIFTNVNNKNLSYGAIDIGGNDTYSITDSRNIGIHDTSATLADTAKLNKNTFNIKNSARFEIFTNEEYNSETNKLSSIDTYNITSSSGTIKDYDEQNDTYKVNKLTGKLTIQDDGGDKDKLIISGTKANNLKLFGNTGWSDLTGTGTRGADNSLYIYDTSANAYIKLENYFDNFYNVQTAEGKGVIESIKAGGKEIGNFDVTNINNIQNTVAAWLKDNNCMTIGDALDSAVNNGTDISGLIACFTNA